MSTKRIALTASDRKTLIRRASELPKGSDERKAILAGLKSAAFAMAASRGKKAMGGDAIVSFELALQDMEIEMDADDGDEDAMKIMESGLRGERNKMEKEALKNLSRMFRAKITTGGYSDNNGLECKFKVGSWRDVKQALDVLKKHKENRLLAINTGVMYMLAEDFRLYPDGPKGGYYGEVRRVGHEGDWDDWLKDHK